MPKLIDITPALTPQTPVFPGDTPFAHQETWSMGEGGAVNVSKLIMSSHAGAHADAPLHYAQGAPAIDEVDLEPYLGPCVVVHVTGEASAISPDAFSAALARVLAGDFPPRILMRTYDVAPARWDPDFVAVAPETIDWLAQRGAKLIGVDTPSLDPANSKTMDAHQAILRHDIRVLEGLKLDHVPAGRYELIAPPLKLKGLDAAPVRALLRTLP